MPRVAVVAFDRISPFHLSVPCIVFGEDRREGGVPLFTLRVCAWERGSITTTAGFTLSVEHGLEALDEADIIIIPSWRDPDEMPPSELLQRLRAAHSRGARIVGLCLGAFVLAATGLLDGRRASTHWAWAKDLADRYPLVKVDGNVLYVDDGTLTTSAGTAAGIDCCLHVLRQRCGYEAANYVARRLVVPPHRQGSQAQFIDYPMPRRVADDRLGPLLDWMRANLALPQSLDELAARAGMSRRTFTRRFQQLTGATVGSWLLAERIAAAQRLLEATSVSIDRVAETSGFGTGASLRQHFAEVLGLAPGAYRRAFRERAEAAGPRGLPACD